MKNTFFLLFIFLISATYSQNVSDNYSIVNKKYYYSASGSNLCFGLYVLFFDSDSTFTYTFFLNNNGTIIADSAYGHIDRISENTVIIKTLEYFPTTHVIIRLINSPDNQTIDIGDNLVFSNNCITWNNENNECVYNNSLDLFPLCEVFFPYINYKADYY